MGELPPRFAATPVRRRDALAAGLGVTDIDREVRTRRLLVPHRGVLLDPRQPTDPVIAAAAAAVATQPRGQAHVSHVSAAALWELETPTSSMPGPVHLIVPPVAATDHRPGVRLHRATLHRDDVECRYGIPVTSVARTVIDLARTHPHWDAVIAADSALRDGKCTLDQLRQCVARLHRLRGVVRARSVLVDCEPRSRSAGETRLRLILIANHLPRPKAGYQLLDEYGVLLAEGDLVYEELLVWMEYDGFLPHTQRDVFRNDRSRERMLRRRGWEILRFVDSDVARPDGLVRDVRAALLDAPRRIESMGRFRSPEVAAARRFLGLL